jgi:hypothetical protein
LAALLASSDDPIDLPGMQTLVQKQLNNIPPSLLTRATVEFFLYHEYNPHPANSDLNITNNFYTRLNSLQGHRGTYYTGALASFACSYCVWDQALRLVDANF